MFVILIIGIGVVAQVVLDHGGTTGRARRWRSRMVTGRHEGRSIRQNCCRSCSTRSPSNPARSRRRAWCGIGQQGRLVHDGRARRGAAAPALRLDGRVRHADHVPRRPCATPWLPYPSSRWSSHGPFGAGFAGSSRAKGVTRRGWRRCCACSAPRRGEAARVGPPGSCAPAVQSGRRPAPDGAGNLGGRGEARAVRPKPDPLGVASWPGCDRRPPRVVPKINLGESPRLAVARACPASWLFACHGCVPSGLR